MTCVREAPSQAELPQQGRLGAGSGTGPPEPLWRFYVLIWVVGGAYAFVKAQVTRFSYVYRVSSHSNTQRKSAWGDEWCVMLLGQGALWSGWGHGGCGGG